MDDVYRSAEHPGGDTLLLPAGPAAGHVAYHAAFEQDYTSNAYSSQFPSLNANCQPIAVPETDLNIKLKSDAAPTGAEAVIVPADNQEQIAALVNSREKEVTELQTTLAVPLAAFNAKFVWHCIMNIERDCEPAFIEKIKNIHKTFYLPPAIAFYTLWMHFRFWHQLRQVYHTVEALLPPPTNSTAAMSKEARVSLMLYMLAASFANKHLDDFSYRNSSWYEAARLPAASFLQIELLALQELHWSLEITAKEWSNWLLHLRTSNITLERTRPTTQTYHFVVARLIQDAILEAGLEKEELVRMGIASHGQVDGYAYPNGMNVAGELYGGEKKKHFWTENSPTLVASSQGASPPTSEGLHARVNVLHYNKNISEGPYGLHSLQRKLENVQRESIINPQAAVKYIPWDTTLDPVVHVSTRSRSGSGSMGEGIGMGGQSNMDPTMKGGMVLDGDVFGHSRQVSYGQWPRVDSHSGMMTCTDMLAYAGGRGNMQSQQQPGYDYMGVKPQQFDDAGYRRKSLEYNSGLTKGMTMRPFKTCNTVALAQGQGFDNYGFDPLFSAWHMRL